MLISTGGPNRPAPKTHKPQAKAPTQTETFADRFSQQAPKEVFKAVSYSTVAGIAAAAVGNYLSTGSVLSSATALGLGAAAGAATGLAAGLGLSALQAANSPASPAPEPVEPKPAPPEPVKPEPPKTTPGQEFAKDMAHVGHILDRRVSSLSSLIRAEKIRTETLNRRGQKAYDEAKALLEQAQKEMPGQRAPIVALENELAETQKRLREVRNQQQVVLNLKLDAETISKDSLGRRGRYAQTQADSISSDLKKEAARLSQAIQTT